MSELDRNPSIDLRATFRPFTSRWLWIALAVLVPLVVVFFYMASKPKEFRASAQVMINNAELDLGDIASLTAGVQPLQEQIYTEIGVILSQPVMTTVVKELMELDILYPRLPEGEEEEEEVSDEIDLRSPAVRASDELANNVIYLRQQVAVTRRTDSLIADVSVTAPDRVWATYVANLIANTYLDFQRQAKVEIADNALLGINAEIESLEREIATAGDQLTEASRRYFNRETQTSQSAAGSINQLTAELLLVRTELAKAEAIGDWLRQASDINAPEATDIAVVTERRGRLAGLQADLDEAITNSGPNSVESNSLRARVESAQAALNEVVNREIRSNQALKETLRTRGERFEILLADAGDALIGAQAADREVARYQQRAAALMEVYASVLTRRSEIAAQRELATPDARLLAEATIPTRSSGPPVLALSFVVGVLGGIFACVWIALKELFRKDYRGLQDLETSYGLLPVGTLPDKQLNLANPDTEWALASQYVSMLLYHNAPEQYRAEGRVVVVLSLTERATSDDLARVLADAAGEFGQSAMVVDVNYNVDPSNPERSEDGIMHGAGTVMSVASSRLPTSIRMPGTTTLAPVSATQPGVVGTYWFEIADDILLIIDSLDLRRDKVDECMNMLTPYQQKVRLLALKNSGMV